MFGGWKDMFSNIETVEHAQRVIKQSAIAFYALAGLTAVLDVVMGQFWGFTDVVVYVLLATLVWWLRSRVAAVLLLLVSVVEAGVTFLNRFGQMHAGGTNIFLAVIIVIAAGRAVQATFILRSLTVAARTNSLVRS